jgi:hypothetical protein
VPWIEISIGKRFAQNKKARNGWRALIPRLTNQSWNLERTPAIAVSNLSFEHVLLHVELAGRFSTSSEGVSATNHDLLRDRLTYGSRIVSNHEQGREIILSKDQSSLRLL